MSNPYLHHMRRGSAAKSADEIELEELKAAMLKPENIFNQDKMAEIQTKLQEMIDRREKAGLPMDVSVSPSDLVDPDLDVKKVLSGSTANTIKLAVFGVGFVGLLIGGRFLLKKKTAE